MKVSTTCNTTDDQATKETTPRKIPTDLPFQIKDLHKKALLILLHRHHSKIVLTYSQLSQEIGVGEKTKAWQCEAWKHLKQNGYIVGGPEKRTFCLSTKGVELASCFASDEELKSFLPPASNEELHDKIRTKLLKDKHGGKKHLGCKIFDIMLDGSKPNVSKTRLELAWELDCNPDSHGFFYGFSALQKMGLVKQNGNVTREELKRKFNDLHKVGNDKDEESGDKEDSAEKDKPEDGKEEGTESSDKEKEQTPPAKKKRRKTTGKPRIRGGTQLFQLSEKAFLATASTTSKSTGATE